MRKRWIVVELIEEGMKLRVSEISIGLWKKELTTMEVEKSERPAEIRSKEAMDVPKEVLIWG